MGHKHLTLDKREILQRLFEQGHSMRFCARVLGYSPSAISREFKKGTRNKDGKGPYDHRRSHSRTVWHRRRASCKGKQFDPAVLDYVRQGLRQYWSPEQICSRMRLDFPEDPHMRISFKTIYRWLDRGVKVKPFHPWKGYSRYLRLKRSGKSFSGRGSGVQGRVRGLPCIEDRPGEANQRSRFGDWECDLMRGFRSQGYLVTLLERSLGLLLAQPCKDKSLASVNQAILSAFGGFPSEHIKTITVDRGKEFYGYKQLQNKLKAEVFFCHPNSPGERGQNEQAIGLLRQFFPKHKPLNNIPHEKIQWAVSLINNRPKKKYGYRTTRELIEQRGPQEVLRFI